MGISVDEARQVAHQGNVAIESSRAEKEVEGQIVMAKRYPRNQQVAISNIMKACERKKLAEQAVYSFPRGGQTVTGPSIRLAEVMAQNWGNLSFGIREIVRHSGSSEMQAYCWDLESNVFVERKFTTRHIRDTKRGSYDLTDERDIYELTANQGARRLRACILEIIPGDVQDSAIEAVDRTLSKQDTRPLAERIQAMITAFSDKFGVTKAQIEKHVGHIASSITETEMVNLKHIYGTLADAAASVDQFFDTEPVKTSDSKPDRPESAPQTASEPVIDPQTEARPSTPPEAQSKDSDEAAMFSDYRKRIMETETQDDLDLIMDEYRTSDVLADSKKNVLSAVARTQSMKFATDGEASKPAASGDFE